MYKKAIILMFIVSLILMFGCTKEENPFSPQKGGFNDTEQENLSFIASLAPGDGGTIQDIDPSTGEVEGEIIIYFEDFMDVNTVTTSNIVVRDTSNSSPIIGASLIYYPEIKKVVFRGTFADDAVFVVTLKSGLRNVAGVQLDGNDNGWADGSPYDDFRYRLRTGTGSVGDVDFDHPEINSIDPGNTNGASLLPMITVMFTDSDIDTTTLTLNNFKLMKTSNQSPVTCTLFIAASNAISFQPKDSIDQTTQYTVTVKCSSVKDTCGNVLLGYVGEHNGWIANIPDYTWDFITLETDTLHDGDPPQVSSVNVAGEELVVSFDDDMSTSTFTTANIRIFNNATGQNLVGSIINEYDETGFRYTLENAVTGTTYKLWISKDVKEAAPGNWYLDGNGNGVGGEWDDDFEQTFVY